MVNEITSIRINAKCSDLFAATLHAKNGNRMGGVYFGYVPSIMPGDHYGDYVELDIELSTGKILNWHVPSKKAIAEFASKCTHNQ